MQKISTCTSPSQGVDKGEVHVGTSYIFKIKIIFVLSTYRIWRKKLVELVGQNSIEYGIIFYSEVCCLYSYKLTIKINRLFVWDLLFLF